MAVVPVSMILRVLVMVLLVDLFVPEDRKVIVTNHAGTETRGRLLRVTANELTMAVDGQDRTLAREQVAAIFEQGDSVKNGMKYGFLAGTAVGFTAGVSKTQCGRDQFGIGFITSYGSYSPCTASERVSQGLREGLLLGLLGTGIGAGIDALIPGRRLLYEKTKPAAAATISIVPSVARSRMSLLTSVSW